MSFSRSTGLTLTAGLATAITLAIAWPVVLGFSHQVYGREIVGRHPDIHAAIFQFGSAATSSLLSQPLTSISGWLLGRFMNPVAALNVVILLSFPLAAVSTYLLARYLHGSHGAAVIAGLVFAFAPVHLAQAAYHPYVTQTYWIPIYFLALIALVDKGSLLRGLALLAAGAGLMLSNYDAALICAFLSPVIVVAFWGIRPDATENFTPLIWLGALLIIAIAVLALTIVISPNSFSRDPTASLKLNEIQLYRARWWAYFTPSVDHPVLGQTAAHVFSSRNINFELLEEQVFVGFGFLSLALVAFAAAAWTWQREWRFVVAIVGVGLAAAIISVGPTSGSCLPFSLAPACLVVHVVPAFRVYARFGIAVNLAVAIAAGAGAAMLARHSRTGRVAAIVLLVIGAFEFWPFPARAHDVLPTAAHRWVTDHPREGMALDCYPATPSEQFVPWLMKRTMASLNPTIPTCADPELGQKLAALGYSQLIVRGGEASSKLLSPLPQGITVAREFSDSTAYDVATVLPPILTVGARGFHDYEHDAESWWRWMGPQGQWTVRNTTPMNQRGSLAVELVPIGVPRMLTVTIDGTPTEDIALGMDRKPYVLGPWTFSPGDHVVAFVADGEPMRPSDVSDSKDLRLLTVSFRNERWIEER